MVTGVNSVPFAAWSDMDRPAEELSRNADGLLPRIRWVNVARLLFLVVVAAMLAGRLPDAGGGTEGAPDLGLPESVLRPPVPAPAPPAGTSRPLPRKRAEAPAARPARVPEGRSVRRRSKRPRPAPRVADSPTAPASPSAAYVAPPAPGTPTVGEFGP
jgi:hypothetical protein